MSGKYKRPGREPYTRNVSDGAEQRNHGPTAVLARTRSLLPSLSPSESAVAREVLKSPFEVVHLNVETLADRVGMSTTTVLRFCRSLGFSGFRDFKIALASELHDARPLPAGDVAAGDTMMDIVRKVFHADLEAIRETLDMLQPAAFQTAVEALSAARRVEFYGIGSSAPIALDAYYRMLRIGLDVSVATDSHMMEVSASLLGRDDVAFIVSHTGRTRETLGAARRAKESGATVIALTSYFRTPLVEASHTALVTATSETSFRAEAMSSRIAHLSVVDALYTVLATRYKEGSEETLERTSKIIEDKRVR